MRTYQPTELHSKSGSEGDFEAFVEGIYYKLLGKRKRVELVEMQAALLARGWHP